MTLRTWIREHLLMYSQSFLEKILMVVHALLRHLLMGVMMGYLLMISQVLQRHLLMDDMMKRYQYMGAKDRTLLMDVHSSMSVT